MVVNGDRKSAEMVRGRNVGILTCAFSGIGLGKFDSWRNQYTLGVLQFIFSVNLKNRSVYTMDFNMLFGALIGSIITGAIIGAIPAICGAIKGKIGLAIGGFFACLVSALILGMILAIPCCALFLFLIFKKKSNG